jgi:DNA-nicking Smr family endonuclease
MLNKGATVLMTAASSLLAEGNEEGYREKKAAADKLRAESLAAFDEAQRLSWSANNKAQQAWQVDLHGLGTSVALRKFVSQFSGLEAMASGHPGGVLYQVITGKGKHSEDNVPKIKLGVLQYLQERGDAVLQQTGEPWAVSWQVDPCNEGCVNVYIPGCSEEEGQEGGSGA